MKWPKERLSRLILPVKNWNPQGSYEDRFFYVDISSVDANQKKIVAAKTIPCVSAPSRARQLVNEGDVLVSTVRPNLNCVASVQVELNGATASTGFCVLRCDKAVLDPRYLFHWVQSKAFVGDMVTKATGASYPAVSDAIIHASELPLPPLEEQRRIAALLDKAGQILFSSRQGDSLRKHLKAKLFISMFGDPRSNPHGWPRLSIEALTSDYVGGAALAPEGFVSQGIPVLHKGAIKPGGKIEVDSKKKGFVAPQTAQNYTRSLAGPGRVAVTLRDLVPSGPFIGLMADLSTGDIPEYLLAQGAYAFRLDTKKVLPDYLIAIVNMPTFRLVLRQNAVGSTQIHIRLPVFKSIEIPV